MGLLLVCLLLLFAGLGLVQAWTIWLLKREVARLEFRLGEALDDEDLLEFQERLQALLSEAKATSARLTQAAEERRKDLEQALEKARLAEKSLALRLVAKSAAEAGTAKPKAGGAAKVRAKGKAAPARPAQAQAAPERPQGAPPAESAAAPVPGAPVRPRPESASKLPDAAVVPRPLPPVPERRSYLSRPKEAAPPSRHQRIYDLADQGLDVDAIARQSGLLAGEVDLILSLRRKE